MGSPGRTIETMAENAPSHVTRRKVSGNAQRPGRDCRDAFLGLANRTKPAWCWDIRQPSEARLPAAAPDLVCAPRATCLIPAAARVLL